VANDPGPLGRGEFTLCPLSAAVAEVNTGWFGSLTQTIALRNSRESNVGHVVSFTFRAARNAIRVVPAGTASKLEIWWWVNKIHSPAMIGRARPSRWIKGTETAKCVPA